jgi:hypothetical protein
MNSDFSKENASEVIALRKNNASTATPLNNQNQSAPSWPGYAAQIPSPAQKTLPTRSR